ncbi:MAG: hypothetical protein CMF69_09450 [Magnetovibrio sp.]|nr:hypothetical protein [Magnetovibrio sp.]|tara:strand:+ start:2657 stop:3907 length:1251 start_codon:yes stop_codon:yes gene_type:complete
MSTNAALIRPFRGLRPAEGFASAVIAPPYDVVTFGEARAMAIGRPWSFLHVSRAEIDLPEGTDPHDNTVYTKASENFNKMISKGILTRDPKPAYYIYQLKMKKHVQTGIVGAGSIKAYEENRIRRHELTRPDKENDRVRQIETLNAQTGPVMVTHKYDPDIRNTIDKIVLHDANCSVMAENGVEHSIWVVNEQNDINALNTAFDRMEAIYIADGHHRSASASRVAEKRRANKGYAKSAGMDESLLIVSFPDNEVQILDYNRIVHDLNGLSSEDFLNQLNHPFSVTALKNPAKPERPRQYTMYLDSQWYSLNLRVPPRVDNPVAALDISILTKQILSPILGIGDPRLDKRIDFIGGIRGMGELQNKVDSGTMAVAFALYPTSLSDLMAVADAGDVMPPKSTWFEPKLADGLISLILE